MGVWDYSSLRTHVGHRIVCVAYGRTGDEPHNVAVECETCNEVLLDYNHPEVDECRVRVTRDGS